MKIPELLAPAGSFESLVAAIGAGADAVYMGGTRFGARKFAENFDNRALQEAVAYAHLRNVRVYVTVNTLITDSEIRDAADYLSFLYETGVDAILVQDPGVVVLVQEVVPGLPLHASTQMSIYDVEGVAFAREQGFLRVVLARELSLGEIVSIAEAPECRGTGIEIFVHGALCYSYSGRCLLSSVIGGRSGNRGMCAQPCRKPYTLVTGPPDEYGRPLSLSPVPGRDRYLLSTRDLCLYRHLDRVVRTPVVSLKIEGRMRSTGYVTAVVSVYRKALDAIEAGSWTPSKQDEERLALAFNRGFTPGYAMGARHREIMGRERPDHRGLPVGTVVRTGAGAENVTVRLSGEYVPEPGDGMVFFDPVTMKETGTVIDRKPVRTGNEVSIRIHENVRSGAILYLTKRKATESPGALPCRMKGPELPFLDIDITVVWDEMARPVIAGTMQGKNGMPVHYCLTGPPMARAVTSPLSGDQITRQLVKSGGTPFRVRHITINYPGGYFAPVGVLNQLRRDFFRGASEAIIASWQPSGEYGGQAANRPDAGIFSLLPGNEIKIRGSALVNPLCLTLYASEANVAEEGLDAGCDLVYFEPDPGSRAAAGRCGPKPPREQVIRDRWEPSLSELDRLSSRFPSGLAWKWPSIAPPGFPDMAIRELPGLMEEGLSAVMTENAGQAFAVRKKIPGASLVGGPGLNICNHLAAKAMYPMFGRLTISPEISSADIASLVSQFPGGMPGPEFEVYAQGNLEVLVSRDCLPAGVINAAGPCVARGNRFTGIGDETGRVFPLWTDIDCRTYLGNSHETCLVDQLPVLAGAGVHSVSIDARHRTRQYAREMISIYREAITRTQAGDEQQTFGDLLNKVKKLALGGITAAHFRGSLG